MPAFILAFALAGLCLALPAEIRAEPAVLGERGTTAPVEEYDIPRFASPSPPQPSAMATFSVPGPDYPVQTPGLSPGTFAAYSAQLPALAGKPLFLVGSDTLSRDWLARHQARLAAIHAVGLLVQAENPGDYEAMQALAGPLPLSAVNADELAQALGLRHYPALVSAGRVEQ